MGFLAKTLLRAGKKCAALQHTLLNCELRATIMTSQASSSHFKLADNPLQKLNFIGGKRVETSGAVFDVIEPSKGELLCQCQSASNDDVNKAVEAAEQAFENWSQLTGLERGKILKRAADLIRENLEDISQLETRDNGKPTREARWDIEGVADYFDFYGGAAATIMGEHIPVSGGHSFAYTRREPLGAVGGVGAWNYPFQTASWKVAPALACGNTFVYKPSPLTPVTAVILAEVLTAAGAPPGVINVVQGGGDVGNALCTHPGVKKVSFTGSVPTGQKIMQSCASGGLKPVTLELGGKGALLIFEDANLQNAVTGAMMANFFTAGEVCSNASLVYVHSSLLPAFKRELLERTKKLKFGDPHDDKTRVGATISEEHMEKVLAYIEGAKSEGATVLHGGERVKVPECPNGYYLSPCILTDIKPNMRVAQEEIFGSVLLLIPFENEDDVVARANSVPFGLGTGLFTGNLQRAHRVAAKLQSGVVWINSYNVTPVEVPFGGQKMSGFGREGGLAAVQNYTQLKSVYVDCEPVLPDPFE